MTEMNTTQREMKRLSPVATWLGGIAACVSALFALGSAEHLSLRYTLVSGVGILGFSFISAYCRRGAGHHGRSKRILLALAVSMAVVLLCFLALRKVWECEEWDRAVAAFAGFDFPRNTAGNRATNQHGGSIPPTRVVVLSGATNSSLSRIWTQLPRRLRAHHPDEAGYIVSVVLQDVHVDDFSVGGIPVPAFQRNYAVTLWDNRGSTLCDKHFAGTTPRLLLTDGEVVTFDGNKYRPGVSKDIEIQFRDGKPSKVLGQAPEDSSIADWITEVVAQGGDL